MRLLPSFSVDELLSEELCQTHTMIYHMIKLYMEAE
jgi:hypothetical protein